MTTLHRNGGNFFSRPRTEEGKERKTGDEERGDEGGRDGKSHRETEGQEQERRTHRDKERQKENKEAPQEEHT